MFRSYGEYKGYEITEVLGGTWIVLEDGERVNYHQEYFEDIYAVYKWIDRELEAEL